MRHVRVPGLFAAALGAAALAAQTATFTSWPIGETPAELRPAISRADLAIAEMQSSLLRQLHDKLAQGGPALALGACHIDSAALVRRMGRGGMAAGFTSERPRNPRNAPRPWAAVFVTGHAGRQAKDVDGFAVDLGDRVGVLRPMVEQPVCASCHGPVERMAPAMRELLSERYPNDRAIGFKDGEIRGWFWVEVPKAGR